MTNTPGQWKVHPSAPYSVWSGDVQVAACRVMEADKYGRHTLIAGYMENDDDKTAANARLIAAAPEMLALIRRFSDKMQALTGYDYLEDEAEEARALLARVEGKDHD